MARKSRVRQSVLQQYAVTQAILAGIYTRLSVEDGDDLEQNSIGNQKKIATHFLAHHPEITPVGTYTDNGISGMTFKRPDFIRMMEDVRAGRINCIVVKDISRLGRHFVMTSEYVERIFPEIGVRLICINDDYDSASETADAAALMMPFKMIMNDSYVKDISKKIRSSISTKIDNGEYLPSASSIPYGYLRNPTQNTYDIDAETAPIVRRIFEMRAAGMKFNAIARQLNFEGVPCPGRLRYLRGITKAAKYENALWIRGTIRKITNDRVYLGERIHGRVKRDKVGMEKKRRSESEWTVVKNAHPAIITEKLFACVAKVNEEELAHYASFEDRKEIENDMRSIFQGKIFCAECGSTMTGAKGCARPDAKTSSRAFFDCNTYKYSNHSRCSSHYIRQEALEETVANLLRSQICIAVKMEKLIADIERSPAVLQYQQTTAQSLTSIQMKRRSMEGKIEQLLVDLTERLIDRNEYEYMKARYSVQRDALLALEAKADHEAQELGAAMDTSKKWLAMIYGCQKAGKITREIVDCLVRRIEVDHDKNIRVILNYEDPYQALANYMSRIEVTQDAG